MKKILKVLIIIVAIIILAITAIGLWVNFGSAPSYPTKSPKLAVQPDSASLQRGAKMVKHICSTCHMGEDGKLSGQLVSNAESDFGEFWSGNITKHPSSGIGRYSDEELVYLFRTGIKKDGHFAGPYMTKATLSDEDIISIIKFLRSDDPLVNASDIKPPAPKYSFLVKALEKFGLFSPEEYSSQKLSTPSTNNTIKFGRYLATEVYECSGCHSASFATNNLHVPEESAGFFGGGNLIGLPSIGAVFSPNITMHSEDGIGKLSEAQFAKLLRQGIRPDNTKMTRLMPRFSSLDDKEIHAIWEYLNTVPVLEKNN